MRRHIGEMNGEKLMGDKRTKIVHDLDNEKLQCCIEEIIRSGNEIPFNFIFESNNSGYKNCTYCKGNSSR